VHADPTEITAVLQQRVQGSLPVVCLPRPVLLPLMVDLQLYTMDAWGARLQGRVYVSHVWDGNIRMTGDSGETTFDYCIRLWMDVAVGQGPWLEGWRCMVLGDIVGPYSKRFSLRTFLSPGTFHPWVIVKALLICTVVSQMRSSLCGHLQGRS